MMTDIITCKQQDNALKHPNNKLHTFNDGTQSKLKFFPSNKNLSACLQQKGKNWTHVSPPQKTEAQLFWTKCKSSL